MPTLVQITAYECGIRFSQALVLTDICWPVQQPDLQAATFRLMRSFNSLMYAATIPPQCSEVGTKLIEDCLSLIRQPHEESIGWPTRLTIQCRNLLQLIGQEITATIDAFDTTDQMLRDWFQLGVEIVDGDRDNLMNPSTGVHYTDDRATWSLKNPEKVEELLKRLDVTRSVITPRAEGNIDDLFRYLFTFLVPQWSRVETGLGNLIARCKSQRTLAPKATGKKKKGKRGRKPNPARDAEINAAVEAGKSHDQVAIEFHFKSASTVSRACKRHRGRQESPN